MFTWESLVAYTYRVAPRFVVKHTQVIRARIGSTVWITESTVYEHEINIVIYPHTDVYRAVFDYEKREAHAVLYEYGVCLYDRSAREGSAEFHGLIQFALLQIRALA